MAKAQSRTMEIRMVAYPGEVYPQPTLVTCRRADVGL